MSEGASSKPDAALPKSPSFPPEHLADAPPLAGMCALAAVASTALNQLAVPALPGGIRDALYTPLDHAGRFAENLAVVAGVVALLATSLSALRSPAFGLLRRRLIAIVFLTVLLRAVVTATLLEREATTSQNVYYAIGAANVLSVLAGMAVLDGVRSMLARVVAGLATATPLISMLAVTLDLATDVTLDPWTRGAYAWLSGCGEVAYLALLGISALMLVPREMAPRAALSRMFGLFVLLSVLLGLTWAQRKHGTAFPVFMYHAQRVDLLLEHLPVAYALPIGVGLAAAVSAVVAGGARFQAGAGLLLVIAAGNTPAAPGRLLCMTLGFVLFGRAVASLDAIAERRAEARAPSAT